MEYAALPPLFTFRISAEVLFVLCTQYLAKADDAVAEDALITLVAAYSGFRPFVMMFFLENSIRISLVVQSLAELGIQESERASG